MNSSNNIGSSNIVNNIGNRFGNNLPFAKPSPFTSSGGGFLGGRTHLKGPQSDLSGVSVTLEKFSADDLGVDDDLGLSAASKSKQTGQTAVRDSSNHPTESHSQTSFDLAPNFPSGQLPSTAIDEDLDPKINPFFNIPETLPEVSLNSFEALSILGLVPDRPPPR
jgi:hypothetical protein